MAQARIPLDSAKFSSGMTWKDYMAQMGDNRALTEENYSRAALTDEERKFFSGLNQVKYAMMLAENWCGDVVRNSPIMARICEAMPGCELRVLFRDKNLDVTDQYLNNGYRSIPVVAFFDKDWNEVGRWLERAHAATAKVLDVRSKTVDAAPADQKDAAMGEFRKAINAEYKTSDRFWREAVKEVRLTLETRLGLIAPTARQ